jgi:serine/threonine protein phosphatase PrpC
VSRTQGESQHAGAHAREISHTISQTIENQLKSHPQQGVKKICKLCHTQKQEKGLRLLITTNLTKLALWGWEAKKQASKNSKRRTKSLFVYYCMGCTPSKVSSSAKNQVLEEDHKGSSMGNKNSSDLPPVNVNVDDNVTGPDPDVVGKVDLQRRRLSVTPRLVGDVQGHRLNPTEEVPANPKSPRTPGGRRMTLGPIVPDGEIGIPHLDAKAHHEDQLNHIADEHVAVTKKGFVPYNLQKVNQDSYILHPKLFGKQDIGLFGVCDGHGEHGHQVSAFVREKLPAAFEEIGEEKVREAPEDCIKAAVTQMIAWLGKTRINVSVSGTTAVFALKIGKKLYSANIGDSRCVLGRLKGDEIVPVALSIDHKPEHADEKKRILASGGRVATLPGPPNTDLGPERVWLRDFDIPGLAMSRSIGDAISHTVGVIADPEIIVHDILDEDLFVLWASDGVWEFVSNDEAVHIIRTHLPNFELAAQNLVLTSEDQWKKNESVIDDITCVLLVLRDL